MPKANEHERAQRYARKYLLDDGPRDATDAAIRTALAGCALPPRPAWYPAIRAAIAELHKGA